MKKLLILLSFISVISNAQQSKEAKDLLEEVAKKVESYNNISIEFTHKLDNDEADVHQETRGEVVLQKELYFLNYMGTEQLFDGKKTYLIIHEDEEVIIQNKNSANEENLSPSKLFSFYKNGYTFQMGDLKNIKGIKIQYVKLTPIDSRSEIDHIMLGIDSKTKHIYNVIEVGKNKTITTLEVRSFKTNQPISNKLFVFDRNKYENEKNYIISEPN